MANTYTQLYVHIVFAVEHRRNLIPKEHKEELHKFITGIITNNKHKMIRINSMPDHMHIFIGLAPSVSLSELVKDIKANSSRFINKKQWCVGQFKWQNGYSAFSYAHSQLDSVSNYIINQEQHHSHRSFREEYVELLKRFNIDYDDKYLFHSVSDDES
ncbi:IS200/IS605 family transposase [Candidatus Poribacteria bacterium]|nr:IS200/IS605 family transposase [Candidatus Poribacteria bacterium]